MIRALALGLTFAALSLPAIATAQPVASAGAAVLRGLDRLSGELSEYEVAVGDRVLHGDLMIEVRDCRFPRDNPSGDAFGFLVIRDIRVDGPVFEGWMVASSPALNALDHMRYDVWLIRCKTS